MDFTYAFCWKTCENSGFLLLKLFVEKILLIFTVYSFLQFDSDNTPFYDKTTCSPRAYLRGKGQKIIGFSYYGDSRSAHHQKKKYFEGIQNNLKLLQKFYPGIIKFIQH